MKKDTKTLSCMNFSGFIRTEKDALFRAIDEDKWYLSERAGYDVGWDLAKRHFVEHFLDGFAERYRQAFCEKRCDLRATCELYIAYRQQCGQTTEPAIF